MPLSMTRNVKENGFCASNKHNQESKLVIWNHTVSYFSKFTLYLIS